MSGENGFTSIADVLAASARKSREEAAKLRSRILAGGRNTASSAKSASSPTGRAGNGELLDDFDHAIQAVQMARKSLPPDSISAEKAAVTILIAKRRLSGPDATDLVRRAIRYLDD